MKSHIKGKVSAVVFAYHDIGVRCIEALVAQCAVHILSNDTAFVVFQKLKCAAEAMLLECIPEMIAGSVSETPQELADGSYFSGRKPEDGRIDWGLPAWEIHNLIRAVAPPYPGAFCNAGLHLVEIMGSYYRGGPARFSNPCIYFEEGDFWTDCIDRHRFLITDLRIDKSKADPILFGQDFGKQIQLVQKTKS